MSYRTCDHLKEDGVFCQSPALRNQNYCYFHLTAHARRLQMAQARRRGEACRIQLPLIEDMHAVQVSLQQVLDALSEDRIDHKRAGLMLYALQQAATNLNSTPEWKGSRPQVEIDHPLRAIEAPSLEQQYELPLQLDLAAPPDVALAQAELREQLPADQQVSTAPPCRLERVPNFAAKKYFQDVDDAHEDDQDDGPGSYKSLRRALDELLAARAGLPDGNAPAPARLTEPDYYGEAPVEAA